MKPGESNARNRRLHDRLLDLELGEVVGRDRVPDLVGRVEAALEARDATGDGAEIGGRVGPGRRPTRLFGWALASAAAVVLALLVVEDETSRDRAAAIELTVVGRAGTVALHDARARVVSRGEVAPWRVARGAAMEFGGIGLGAEKAVAELVTFGTLTGTVGARIEVREVEIMTKNGTAVLGALTVGVVAGAVGYHAFAGGGDHAAARAGDELELVASDGGTELLAAHVVEEREAELRDRIASLERDLEAARRGARRVAETADVDVPGAEAEPVLEAVDVAGPPLEHDALAAALAAIDWKVIGGTTADFNAAAKEIADAFANGEDPSLEAIGQVQRLNGRLIEQAQHLVDGQVPGAGVNGAYTHPAVVANAIHASLAANGLALTDEQAAQVEAVMQRYAAEDEGLRLNAAGHDVELDGLLAELEMKNRMYAEFGGVLTAEQSALLYPEGYRGRSGLDLFDSSLVTAQFAKPMPITDRADFGAKLMRGFQRGLRLDDAAKAKLDTVMSSWVAELPDGLLGAAGDPLDRRGMFESHRVHELARAQVTLLRKIMSDVPLTPEQRAELQRSLRIAVPVRTGD